MTATLALVGGRIRTMDPDRPIAEAVACEGSKIVAVGAHAAVAPLIGQATRVISLRGKCVIPGLIDAHAHLAGVGARLLRFDLTDATTYEEIVRRSAVKAQTAAPGEWIVGRGWELPGTPDNRDLCACTQDNPVWLRRNDGHSGLANHRALASAGIDARTPDPAGGRIGRDEQGAPTGMLYESAMDMVERRIPERPSALEEEITIGQAEYFKRGVTCVHDAKVDAEMAGAFERLELGRKLKLRVYGMFWRPEQKAMAVTVREKRPLSNPGSRFSLRAIKLFTDGSLGSNSAWMLQPEAGVPRLNSMEVEIITRAAVESGWQVCAHAIGTRANREVLTAYERVLKSVKPGDYRLRVEHAQHVDLDDIPRFGKAGIIASVQPAHAVADRRVCEERFDKRVVEGSYAWRSLMRGGARLALGTDAPVVSADPRWTFACAVTRNDWRVEEALARDEAVRGMTADAAWAGFMEGERGRIVPGLDADLAVLSHDWIETGEAMKSEVLLTAAAGEIVHAAPEFR